jgi:hypothetical protein
MKEVCEMVLHDKGAKAQRDRAKCMAKYIQLCNFMHVKKQTPTQLSKLSVMEFYRLCEDIYNAQTIKKKIAYSEEIGACERSRPLRYHWFFKDLMAIYAYSPCKQTGAFLTAPFRYPGFVRRKKAHMDKVKAAAKEQAEKTLKEFEATKEEAKA